MHNTTAADHHLCHVQKANVISTAEYEVMPSLVLTQEGRLTAPALSAAARFPVPEERSNASDPPIQRYLSNGRRWCTSHRQRP